MFTGSSRRHHPEAETSQKVTDQSAQAARNHHNLIPSDKGWILRIQKFRAGIDLWFLYADFLLNALYHVKEQMKIREFRLQKGIFVYKAGISFTKGDFHLQNGSFALQTGLSPYYSPDGVIAIHIFIENQ